MLYTTSISYRAALISIDAIRIDLNGYEAGKVSPKAKYIAKTHCQTILWELEKEGYEHQKMLAQRHKRQGTYTPEVMAHLFPQSKKIEKFKKPPTLKQLKQTVLTTAQTIEPAKPLSAQSKKPATIIIKKKKNLIFD